MLPCSSAWMIWSLERRVASRSIGSGTCGPLVGSEPGGARLDEELDATRDAAAGMIDAEQRFSLAQCDRGLDVLPRAFGLP